MILSHANPGNEETEGRERLLKHLENDIWEQSYKIVTTTWIRNLKSNKWQMHYWWTAASKPQVSLGTVLNLKPPKYGEQSTLEYRIENRSRDKVENNGGLSLEQYGFRKQISCRDAIRKVVKIANTKNTWLSFEGRGTCKKIPLIIKCCLEDCRGVLAMSEVAALARYGRTVLLENIFWPNSCE